MQRLAILRRNLQRTRFSTRAEIVFGPDAIQQQKHQGNVVLVKAPRYFDESGMVKPFERPSMLVMGISSVIAMFAGTFIMDYLYFEVWVRFIDIGFCFLYMMM
jgi:hypothetical protein